MNFKGEISTDENVYGIMTYNCVKNGMGIFSLKLNVQCSRYNLSIIYMVVKKYNDIQNIHENCLNWYLLHEY